MANWYLHTAITPTLMRAHALYRPIAKRLRLANSVRKQKDADEKERERLLVDASLNAVPFYEAFGFKKVREAVYAHRCGVDLRCVYMEKFLRIAVG